MIFNLLAFLLVIGILVMVHELGHFLAARFLGVKVDKFAIGLPPKIWSIKKGDTEYTINSIPFGGYVTMNGEEGGNAKDPTSFTSKKPWQKSIILIAGVFMNLVLAWVIFTCFYLFGGKALVIGMDNFKGVTNNQHVYVTAVVAGSPASENGLKKGDIILSVNGNVVHDQNLLFSDIQDAKTAHPNQPVAITVDHNGATKSLKIDTYKDKVDGVEAQRIGISMEEKGKTQSAWYLAPWYGLLETGRIAWLILVALWALLVSIFTEFKVGNQIGGPVAIYFATGNAARLGFWAFAQFIALISINLALINILPFPALDGGHVAIIIVEEVTRRKISDKTKQAINNAGLLVLLILMVLLVFRDLINFGVFAKIKGVFK